MNNRQPTPQESGRNFEDEMSTKLGLGLVPGSGNQWHSKLDLTSGTRARWSLKYTEKQSLTLNQALLSELDDSTGAPGMGGEIPILLVRAAGLKSDVVVMALDDFVQIVQEEVKLVASGRQQTEEKIRRSEVPVLLRDEEDGN